MKNTFSIKLILILLTILSLLIVSCTKATLGKATYYQFDWRYTIRYDGTDLDTIWPSSGPTPVNSARILHHYDDFNDENVFHFYINNALVGIKHYNKVNDNGGNANAQDPADYNTYFSVSGSDDNFKIKQFYIWFQPPTNEPLYSVLNFPVDFNITDYQDTMYYSLFVQTVLDK